LNISTQEFSEAVIWAGFGIGLGIYWFIAGFRELKNTRIIQNIPTCKIATGAVGTNVEIQGEILRDENKILKAPITGRDCVFYSVEIQKLVRRKNSSHWVTVDQFFSDEGFIVDDGSGANAMVYVKGATIKRKGRVKTFQARSSNMSELPPNLYMSLQEKQGQLKSFSLKETSWIFSKQYRFLEWSFPPNQSIYVLGVAQSGLRVKKKNKLKMKIFMDAKNQIQSNEELQEKFDRNHDGTLDPDELEFGARILGEQLQLEEGGTQVQEVMTQTKMIFKKHPSSPFIISNMEEKELIKKMSFAATLKVWGGPIVAIASCAFLVFHYSSLP
jgi:hypothetical protein